jgi:bifunctional DNA-binding transcriptional regulator/antitoxin component of YhaV-PrlF toxin-antitoxin module
LEKILGVSKVQPNNRITIIRKVQKKLNVNVGDVLMFIEDDKGNITIKKVHLKPLGTNRPSHSKKRKTNKNRAPHKRLCIEICDSIS